MFSLISKIFDIIVDEVDKEFYGSASVKNQLLKLEQLLKEGKITEEEYDQIENELLERLEESLED